MIQFLSTDDLQPTVEAFQPHERDSFVASWVKERRALMGRKYNDDEIIDAATSQRSLFWMDVLAIAKIWGTWNDLCRKCGFESRWKNILSEWRPIESAPKNATEFLGKFEDGSTEVCHWASDLSGSDQPAFQGFFRRIGKSDFVECKPVEWRPIK